MRPAADGEGCRGRAYRRGCRWSCPWINQFSEHEAALLESRFLATRDSAILDRELRRHVSCPSCPYRIRLKWSEDTGMKIRIMLVREPAH